MIRQEGERKLKIAQLEHELEQLRSRELRGRVVTRWLAIIAIIGWVVAVTIVVVQ